MRTSVTTVTTIAAAVILALSAVAMGWVLGWANRAFHVEVEAKGETIAEALPGANCGGCGFVGCNDRRRDRVARWSSERRRTPPNSALLRDHRLAIILAVT